MAVALLACGTLGFAAAHTHGTLATLTDAQTVTSTLTFEEVIAKVTVTLDANGGSFAPDAAATYGGQLDAGASVYAYAGIASGTSLGGVPTPTRDGGYEFAGWYTEPAGGEYMDALAPDHDVTYYAHWRHEDLVFWALDADGLMVVAPSGQEAARGRATVASDSFSRLARPNWGDQSERIVRVEVVGGVRPTSTEQWFSTERTEATHYAFVGYPNLVSADLSGLNGAELTSTRAMFASCRRLSSVTLGKLKTPNVTVMSWMFAHCSALASLDLSSLDTRRVERMSCLLEDCVSLERIVIGEHWRRADWWDFPSARLPVAMYREDGVRLAERTALDADGPHVYTTAAAA